MSAKAELHDLVDELDDVQSARALTLLRAITTDGAGAEERLARRMGPAIMSGREFFSQTPTRDLAEIAKEQGVRPVSSIDELAGDFWPEEESIDEFLETVRNWRREG